MTGCVIEWKTKHASSADFRQRINTDGRETEFGVNLLDLTTAWVCADVPEAMLVRAQAASNWREGLRDKTKANRLINKSKADRKLIWFPQKSGKGKRGIVILMLIFLNSQLPLCVPAPSLPILSRSSFFGLRVPNGLSQAASLTAILIKSVFHIRSQQSFSLLQQQKDSSPLSNKKSWWKQSEW